ncbi:hypothetical protein GCM10015535_13380 [Streptomyces gelaticus]|uniref:Uncharacterized protein n=1 Tax=Streptomyces gelaticus TaxID=285446 RepID=A0ABQ2VWC3_9ACTN|nr:hypothetical protein GCM10015535_13380 [Streptomyces gelaticus]
MKVEVSASVCCSCDAVRMSVEKGVVAAVASKAGLRGTEGTEKSWKRQKYRQRRILRRLLSTTPIFLLRLT